MSLFPAYDNANEGAKLSRNLVEDSLTAPAWLSNTSYQPTVRVEKEVSSEKLENEVRKEKKRKKKDRKHRKKEKRKDKEKTRKSDYENKVRIKFSFTTSDCSETSIFCDKFRDTSNYYYDSFQSKYVAKYSYPRGLQKCLCLSDKTEEYINSINKQLFETSANKKNDRYFGSSKLRRRKNNDSMSSIVPSLYSDESEKLEEFIPLNSTIVTDDGTICQYDYKLKMYRPIEKELDSAQSLHSEDSLLTADDYKMFSEYSEVKRFSKALNSTPKDATLWKQFLTFQDSSYEEAQNAKHHKQKIPRLAFLERKLAILNKAISHCPNDVELQIIRVNIYREMGNSAEYINKEWHRLEFTFVNRNEMWIGKLQNNLNSFLTFSVDKHLSAFDLCLSKSFAVLSGHLVTHPPLEGAAEFFLNCLLGKVEFLISASAEENGRTWNEDAETRKKVEILLGKTVRAPNVGQSEKAVCTVQALLEFNLCMPEDVRNLKLDMQRTLFEAYWNNSASHLGEAGWQSWRTVSSGPLVKKNENVDECQVVDFESKVIEEEKRLISANRQCSMRKCWLELERLREKNHWLPWSQSSGEPEDPERVVLFEDFESTLYELPSEELKYWLTIEALQALKLATLPRYQSSNRMLFYELGCMEEGVKFHFQKMPLMANAWDLFVDREDRFDVFCDQCKQLLPAYPWACYLSSAQIYNRSFQIADRTDLSPGARVKLFRQYCKKLLSDSEQQNNALLYLAYSNGLARLGDLAESASSAQKTLASVCAVEGVALLGAPFDDVQLSTTLVLLCRVAERCLELSVEQNASRVVDLISSFFLDACSGVRPPAAAGDVVQLKSAFQRLEQRLLVEYEQCLLEEAGLGPSSRHFSFGWLGSSYVACRHVRALLHFSLGSRLEDCQRIYEETREQLKRAWSTVSGIDGRAKYALQLDVERCCEWELWLVNLQSRREFGLHQPAVVIDTVNKLWSDCPNNANLLHTYCETQAKAELLVWLRRSLKLHSADCPWMRYVGAFHVEFGKFLQLQDEHDHCLDWIWRLRGLLETALNHYPQSTLFWRLLVRIEGLFARFNGDWTRVESVAYRAVHRCPYSKALFVDAMEVIVSDSTASALVDLMSEKGIRLRLTMEELTLLRAQNDQFDDSLIMIGDHEALLEPKRCRQPAIVAFHYLFRTIALLVYVFSEWVSGSFIVSCLSIIIFSSVDFWTVKNITGRKLVRLRWWNVVDENGNSIWKFEAKQDPENINPVESQFFWAGLLVFPLLWIIFILVTFFTLKWNWMMICIFALSMTGTNLYGYLRCKWNSRQEISSYLRQGILNRVLIRDNPVRNLFKRRSTEAAESTKIQSPSSLIEL
ncbi:Golgi apparatus membrane protein TVP23 -like protein B [Trichinella britovi]|uniref:Golgi apparatus membrane protein TVP23-like protein B n=1 Tax=Trichinella britovi TaxID=45882 RepID=A0A0V1CMC8_TRIBR|nr:Golgi apparatus membrane protein TVP23 -like protein B [Trichinella britovi]